MASKPGTKKPPPKAGGAAKNAKGAAKPAAKKAPGAKPKLKGDDLDLED
jgi:hypothetical protein